MGPRSRNDQPVVEGRLVHVDNRGISTLQLVKLLRVDLPLNFQCQLPFLRGPPAETRFPVGDVPLVIEPYQSVFRDVHTVELADESTSPLNARKNRYLNFQQSY